MCFLITERLRLLRMEHGLTKRELVKLLPLNYSTYANYETGFREPNSDVLQLLSRHYKVSIDYLLGVSDNRRAEAASGFSDRELSFLQKLRLLDAHGQSLVETVLEKEYERRSYLTGELGSARRSYCNGKWTTRRVFRQSDCADIGDYSRPEPACETMRFATTDVSESADFCVLIEDGNMEPKICRGDIAFVKSVPKIEPENVGIFAYQGRALCGRLKLCAKTGELSLESLAKNCPPVDVERPGELETVGLLIGIAERAG